MDIFYDQDNIIVRTATKEDVEYLSKHMRQCDVDEIWASHHHSPKEALEISLKESNIALTVEDNGVVVAMFGTCPQSLLGAKATVWMLATDGLDKIKRRFAKNSRRFIEFLLSHYPYLFNYVHTNNVKSIEWLRFCGAKFSPPIRYGVEQEVFQYFWFTK